MRYALPNDVWNEPYDLSDLYIYQVPTPHQVSALKVLWSDCDEMYVEKIVSFLEKEGHMDLEDLPIEIYWKLYYAAVERVESLNQEEV